MWISQRLYNYSQNARVVSSGQKQMHEHNVTVSPRLSAGITQRPVGMALGAKGTMVGAGLLGAEITEGPYKGWPVGAAIAIGSGQQSPASIKKRLLAENRLARIRLAHQARQIAQLPDEIVLN